MTNITIYEGSILDFEGDAIVNPANGFLRHGAGLARIIADAAQKPIITDSEIRYSHAERWRQEQRNHPTIPTGGIAVTSAGALPYKAIIHAVGPVWGGGHYCERQLLRSAHDEAIFYARAQGWSVAIPAISCGLFGFPVEIAAPIAVNAALSCPDVPVTFALMEPEHIAAYSKCLEAWT